MGRSPLVAGPGDRLRYHARSKPVRAVATLTVLAALASEAWIGRDQVAEVFAQSSQSDHSQSSAREIEIATARRTLAGIISDTAKAKENLPEGTDTSAYDAARKAADDALAGVDLVEMSKVGADLNAAARALEQVRSEAAAKAAEEAKKAAEAAEAQRQAAEAEAQRQAQQAETPSQTYTPEPTPSQTYTPDPTPAPAPTPAPQQTAQQISSSMTVTCTAAATVTFTASGGGTVNLSAGGRSVSGSGSAALTVSTSGSVTATASAPSWVNINYSWNSNGSCS